jgi:capsular exopolysaccharide synthesis family protein
MVKKESSNEVETSVSEEESGKTFGEYWNMIRKHWVSITICTAVALAAGLTYDLGFKGEEWEVSGSAMVLSVDEDSTSSEITSSDVSYSLTLLQTVNDLMTDDPVLEAVATSLAEDGYKNSSGENYSISQVEDMLTVAPRTYTSTSKSLFIDVTATTSDAALSVKVVNYCLLDTVSLISDSDDYGFLNDCLHITSYAALTSAEDVATSTTLICGISILIGLIVGVIYAIIKELANIFVVSKKELETTNSIKVLASIPDYSDGIKNEWTRKVKRRHEDVGLIADLGSIASENIQKLQTNISFAGIDKPLKVISVTSANQSEGKSTTLGNMAKIYAEKDLKVCVIDLDIRRPSMHHLFGIENKVGIVEYVRGEADLKHIIHKVNGVDVITAGSKTPFPSKIIQSPKLAELIGQLRETYDFVLIDTTPVIAVADALLVSKIIDGFIVVCAQHSTVKTEFKEAIEVLKRANANIIGAVMTMVTEDDAHGEGKYGYGYGYGYGSTKEDEKSSKGEK